MRTQTHVDRPESTLLASLTRPATPPSLDRLVYLTSADLQDDDLGLREVVCILSSLAPAAPLDERIRLARRAVSVLVGQYDLWRGEWPTGPVARVTDSEMQTLAHDDTPWHDPEQATLLAWLREEGSAARQQTD